MKGNLHAELFGLLKRHANGGEEMGDTSLVDPEAEVLVDFVERVVRCYIEGDGSPRSWAYLRIPCQFNEVGSTVRDSIGPAIASLKENDRLAGWWWLMKEDRGGEGLRLRIGPTGDEAGSAVQEMIALLRASGLEPTRPVYEPEICLFGGEQGTALSHELFTAHSEFLCACIGEGTVGTRCLVPLTVELASSVAIMSAVGLDLFERWEQFEVIRGKRNFYELDSSDVERLRQGIAALLDKGVDSVISEFGTAVKEAWEHYSERIGIIGDRLVRCHLNGILDCGVKAWVEPVILFNWNRAGLDARLQCVVAAGMVTELRRRARG